MNGEHDHVHRSTIGRLRVGLIGVVTLVMLLMPGVTGQAARSDKGQPPELSAAEIWASTGGRYSDEYSRILDALDVPASTNGVIRNPKGSSLIGSIRQAENEPQVLVALSRDRDTAEERQWLSTLVARVAPEFDVIFEDPVAFSQADLIALADEIMGQQHRMGVLGTPIHAATPLHGESKVLVFVDDEKHRLAVQLELSEKYGSVVQVVGPIEPAARHNDTPPYYGGIRLSVLLPGSQVGTCTSGFAVTKPGFGNYMLTAGHCVQLNTGVSVNRHNGGYMGYSSATDQNADAALITGSYAPRIWLDGVTSNRSRAVAGATVTEHVGDVVCTGGALTGQVCRNRIVTLDQPTSTGVRALLACNWEGTRPVQGGDSGGPAYRVDSAARLWGHGIIYGGVNPPNQHCFAYVPMWKVTERTGAVLRTS